MTPESLPSHSVKEIHESSITIVNGSASLTESGLKAHRLTLINRILANNGSFAIDPEMKKSLRTEWDALCQKLGIVEDASDRDQVILGLEFELTKSGFPPYQIGPKNDYPQRV